MNMFDANKTHNLPLSVSDVSKPSQLTNKIFSQSRFFCKEKLFPNQVLWGLEVKFDCIQSLGIEKI
jgi:hypothetical protein